MKVAALVPLLSAVLRPAEGATSGLVGIIDNKLQSAASAMVSPNYQIAKAYATPWENGGIDNGRPEEEAVRMRTLMVQAMQAMTDTGTADLVFWSGIGLAGGGSYWIYPINSSWVSSSPKTWHGSRTNGYAWEQQANVTDKFADPFHYRRHNCYWMSDEKNRQGELLLPKMSSYGYSAPDRPFWNYFIQEGNAWYPELSGWAGNPQFLAGTNVFDPYGNFTGHAIGALKIGNMEDKLRETISEVGGVQGVDTWIYVLDENKDIMMASTPGISSTCPGWGSCVSLPAVNTTDLVVKATAMHIIDNQLQRSSDTFVLGDKLVQTLFIDKLGGLALKVGWLIVSVETIDCPPNHFFDINILQCKTCASPFTSKGGSVKFCDLCEPNFFMNLDQECEKCPMGTTCDGSSNMTNIEVDPGYWRVNRFSTDVMECPRAEGCVGSTNANQYCREGYSGVLCAACGKEFYYSKDSNECAACGGPGVTTAVERVRASIVLTLIFFVLIIAIAGALFVRLTPGLRGAFGEKITQLIEWLNVVRLKTKMKLKCLMAFAQISATVSFNCNMRFPDEFESLMNIFSIANIEVIPALGIPCWMKQFDYINTMVSMTVGPLCLIGLIVLVYLANHYDDFLPSSSKEDERMNKTKSKTGLSEVYRVPPEFEGVFTKNELRDLRKTFAFFDLDGGGSFDKAELLEVVKGFKPEATEEDVNDLFSEAKGPGDSIGFGTMDMDGDEEIDFTEFLEMTRRAREEGTQTALSLLADQVDAKVSRNSANNYIYAVLLVTFLVLPGCTTVLFNFFKCREFEVPGGKDVSFMYKDYAIDCNGDRYQSYIGYAVFMIMVYPVGIPLSWMTMLWISRETLSSDKAMNREALFGNPKTGHVSFLVESYVPKYYYFEVVECIRRILLTSAIGLADESTPWSAVLGVVISLVFLFVFSEAKPFKQSENSALGILLMYTLVLLFIAALLAKMGAVNSTSPTFAAILMTLIFGALALGLWFSIVGTDPVGYFNGTLDDGKDEDKMDASNAPVKSKSRLASRSTASVDRPLKEVDVESSITANAAQREAEKETENFTGSFEQVVARLEKIGELEKQGVITKESFDKQVAILNTQLEESL